jgi:hypothetical protein
MQFNTRLETSRFGDNVKIIGFLETVSEDGVITISAEQAEAYADDAASIREAASSVNTKLRNIANAYSRLNKSRGLVVRPVPEYFIVESFSTGE